MKKTINQKGFSLVETLVAITILLIAIAGPLTIAHRALLNANLAKNQTIANFLAQDAFEYIKNLREENNIRGIAWDGTYDVCSGTCTVDSAQDTISVCGGSCPFLKYDSNSGFYGYNPGWPDSIFKRTVTLTEVNDAEISVVVSVTWQNGILSKTFNLRESIFNWHGEDACTGCI